MIDRGGNVISQFGDVAVMDVTIIAALAAGSFAATKELARRIGEVEFNALYHQGNGSHIFMNSVDDDTIMITVFGPRTTVGLGPFLFRRDRAGRLGVVEIARSRAAVTGFSFDAGRRDRDADLRDRSGIAVRSRKGDRWPRKPASLVFTAHKFPAQALARGCAIGVMREIPPHHYGGSIPGLLRDARRRENGQRR